MDFIKLRGLDDCEVYINVDNISSIYRVKHDGRYVTKIYIHGELMAYLVYDSVDEVFDKIMLLRDIRISDGDLINKTSLKENKPND